MWSLWNYSSGMKPLTNQQLSALSGEQKKEYIHKLKVDTAKDRRFKSRCRRCKEKIRSTKYMKQHNMKSRGFTFHHIYYKDGQLTHRNFQPIKGVLTKIDSDVRYQEEVISQVQRDKKQFWFLCLTHHQGLESFMKYNEVNLKGMTRDAIYCKKMQRLANSGRRMD
jgi:hypothetical protein